MSANKRHFLNSIRKSNNNRCVVYREIERVSEGHIKWIAVDEFTCTSEKYPSEESAAVLNRNTS